MSTATRIEAEVEVITKVQVGAATSVALVGKIRRTVAAWVAGELHKCVSHSNSKRGNATVVPFRGVQGSSILSY